MYDESVVSTDSGFITRHGLMGDVGNFVGFIRGNDTERLVCDRKGCVRKNDLVGS